MRLLIPNYWENKDKSLYFEGILVTDENPFDPKLNNDEIVSLYYSEEPSGIVEVTYLKGYIREHKNNRSLNKKQWEIFK